MTDYSDNNRFTPPKAEVADLQAPGNGLVLAGRGARFGAVMLDGVVNSVIFYGLMFLLGRNYFAELPAGDDPQRGMGAMLTMLWAFVPGIILTIVVQGWFLHRWGGTVGKKLLKLRIVRSDGSRAGFARLFFLRAGCAVLLPLVPFLGILFALVDPLLIFRDSRQCLHDNIADTVVVDVSRDPA